MRVLVTGGSGVIGEGLIPALVRRGHTVRLLARGADEATRRWPEAVEPWQGDVTRPADLEGAAGDCDAIVHIAGIVAEVRPDVTFEAINVAGTENLIVEAVRAGAPRFVYVSSLGADRGSSRYHASKRAAEERMQAYPGSWTIIRPGGVYGPGDEVMSQLLQMHRSLPVIPVVGVGDHRFQPIFYRDAGEALAVAAERDDLQGIFEIAGDDVTTPAGVMTLLSEITGRRPIPIPVPEALVTMAVAAAEAAGVPFPLDEAKLRMLLEHNVVEPPAQNALRGIFGVDPTPLREGLAQLADLQPEQEPSEGVGAMEEKRFWADVRGSVHDAETLMALVRERCTDLMPLEFAAEPGVPTTIEEGATLTAAIPMRGNIQVRVQECSPTGFTFATLRGHPLAGVVRFTTENRDDSVRFAITIQARAASMLDWLAMNTVGRGMQEENWRTVVARVVEASGGTAAEIQMETKTRDGEAASSMEREIADLIADQKLRTAAAQEPK